MLTGWAPLKPVAGQGQGHSPSAWPWTLVGTMVAWSLWQLRATVISAQYLDDNSVHQQMVRFATAQIHAGHDPLTSWFLYLGLGSPQFLHYQSTPAILTGLAGLVVGPDAAFRWSLYLLWCLWPVAIFVSARLLRLRPWAAALAAVIAPFLHSAPGIGYEQHAYLWVGYGVWTQLWGSWALPFAWALSWRAVADKRFLAPAAGAVALTAAFHYETGYLAFMAILIMPFLVRTGLRARLLRGAILLALSLLASAWVVVPLLRYARWAGLNQALSSTAMVNGYGAGQTMTWLVSGRIFDAGHLPVISLLVLAGLVAAVLQWRTAGPDGLVSPGRALVALFCAGLLLSFGRTTFGSVVSIIPGSSDLFFRRFLMGAQLAGIYLAGLGAAAAGVQALRLAAYLTRRDLTRLAWAPAGGLAVAAVAYLFPAWHNAGTMAALNSADIHFQQLAQSGEPQVNAAAAYIRSHGDGRVYAGSPSNWGQYYTVGFVPMYAYLESQDVDEVGYTLRTASLMTQPEYHFDSAQPGDYAVFGIRYLMLPAVPATHQPPPEAILVLHNNLLRLYELPGDSYIRVAETVGSITANRANLGSQTVPYLRSQEPAQDRYPTIAYSGAPATKPTEPLVTKPTEPLVTKPTEPLVTKPTEPPVARLSGPPGAVLTETADLANGAATAVVHLHRRGVAVLSASFDPGWSATVDGHPAATQMVAPALVAVVVPPGTHHIEFRYTGFAYYPELLALAVTALFATAALTRRTRSFHGGSVARIR